jgi:hypothetical protein
VPERCARGYQTLRHNTDTSYQVGEFCPKAEVACATTIRGSDFVARPCSVALTRCHREAPLWWRPRFGATDVRGLFERHREIALPSISMGDMPPAKLLGRLRAPLPASNANAFATPRFTLEPRLDEGLAQAPPADHLVGKSRVEIAVTTEGLLPVANW